MRHDKHPSDEIRRERIARARRFFVPGSPAVAAKSDDLESLKKTVEDAASVGAALWFSYVFVLFYIAIAAGGVTHVDLLLERPVKLPFLNVELPLTAFFFLAPIIFIIVHIYVLTHFVLLGRKAKRFHEELLSQIPGHDPNDTGAANKRDKLRGQLPSNIFVQFLAGPRDVRDSAFGVLLRIIAYVTLVLGPLALLLLIQIKFLPYHNIYITWFQRVAVIVDLGLIWWLWRDIISGRGDYRRWFSWTSWVIPLFGIVASVSIISFSFFVVVLPDETTPAGPAWFSSDWFWVFGSSKNLRNDPEEFLSLRKALFEGPVDFVTRKRKSFLSNTLVLPGFNIVSELKNDDLKNNTGNENSIRLRGRDLSFAVFDLAHLPNVDFTGSNLNQASLRGANLRDAILDDSSLYNARLDGVSLQNSSFLRASMDGADLSQSSLQNGILNDASLDDAKLDGINLTRATLIRTHLERSHITNATFQDADLTDAQLKKAKLNHSQLDRALFVNTNLDDANLDGVSLNGAYLNKTSIVRASLQRSTLYDACIIGANLSGAHLNNSQLPGIILDENKLQVSTFDNANLLGASFNNSDLRGASFQEADLRGSSFAKANLQSAMLAQANLSGSLFERANLQAATLLGADLSATTFFRANIQGSDLRESTLLASSFQSALVWRSKLQSSGEIYIGTGVYEDPTIDSDENSLFKTPWTQETYYKNLIDLWIPAMPDPMLQEALERFTVLNCDFLNHFDCYQASRNDGEPRKETSFNRIRYGVALYKSWDSYEHSLYNVLAELICKNDQDLNNKTRAYLLRGILRNYIWHDYSSPQAEVEFYTRLKKTGLCPLLKDLNISDGVKK